MAFIIGAAIIGGTTLASGLIGSSAAKSAANAQAKATDATVAEQRRQYDQTRQDYLPYQQVGVNALNKLGKLYGVQQSPTVQQSPAYDPSAGYGYDGAYGGYGNYAYAPQSQASTPVASSQQITAPDYSDFYNSPDYAFTRSEGLRGVQQSAAARGGAYSGNALRGITDYASGLASQQFGNYSNRLASLAGVGQSANGTLAATGAQASGNIGNALMAGGDARASGIMGAANSWTGAINSGMNNVLLGRGGYFSKGGN
jgi:hypothetical protein